MRLGLGFSVLVGVMGSSAAAAPFPSAWLPREGDGYLIPPTWAERGLRYGTPELVGLIERAARIVVDELPGATLFVADMSLKTGGWTQWHRSHRNGCDADLIYFATDDGGEPRPLPRQMVPFNHDGIAWTALADGERLRLHFDTERNWALIRALLADEEARVVRIFVAAPLRERLLAYAESANEDPRLLARAAEVLVQPGDSEPHNDHMHVRIAPPVGVEQPTFADTTYARVTKAKPHRGKPNKLARHKKVKKTVRKRNA